MDEKRIADLRAERGRGMVSAVGEYTPDELWEALDCIERLRAALQLAMWAMRAPLDDWKGECEREALDAAHAALGPNVGIEPPRSGRLE